MKSFLTRLFFIGLIALPVMAYAQDGSTPTAPTSLTRTTPDTDTTPTFTWNAATDNVGVTRYGILYGAPGSFKGADPGNVLTYTVATPQPLGSYTFSVTAYDAAGNISTAATISYTISNPPADTSSPTPIDQLPDLVIKGISLDSQNHLTVSVKNAGTGNVPQDSVSVYIWIDDQLQWTYNSSTLARKDFLKAGGMSDVQPQVLSGRHRVKSCVDYNELFKESDESNNCMEVTLAGSEGTLAPDLTIENITIRDGKDASNLYGIYVTLKNQGMTAVSAPFNLKLEYKKADGSRKLIYDYDVFRESGITTLEAGATYEFGKAFFASCSTIPTEAQLILGEVDNGQQIRESNEGNNKNEISWPRDLPRCNTASTGLPDVVVNIDKIDRTSIVYAAQPATWITYTVTNKGNASTNAPIFLHPVSNGSSTNMGYMKIDSLAPGSSVTQKFAVGHDSLWPVGKYVVKLEADYDNAIAESNENNNSSNEQTFTVTDSSTTTTSCQSPYVEYQGKCVDPIPACQNPPANVMPSTCIDKIENGKYIERYNFQCMEGYTRSGSECVKSTTGIVVSLTSFPRPTNGSSHENGYLAVKVGDKIQFTRLIEQKDIVYNGWNWHWDKSVLDCSLTPNADSSELVCKVISATGGSVVFVTTSEVQSNMIKVYTMTSGTPVGGAISTTPARPMTTPTPTRAPLPTFDTGAGFEDAVVTANTKNPFSDTDMTTLVGQAAASLHALGIIGGYVDGTFKGNRPVNRAEAAKFLLLSRYSASALQDLRNEGKFWDVLDGQWYTQFIMNAYAKGLMSGYPDGSMGPDKNVNTAEFLKMLSLNFALPANLPYSYADVSSDSWFAPYAGIAVKYNLFPDRKDKLSPGNELTRADVAVALYQYLSKK